MDPSENRGVRPWNMDSYHPVPRASIDIASTGNSVSEGPTSYGLLKKEPRVSYSSRTSTTPGAPLARGSIASWGLELLSVGISLASITAIIVILHFENGKPLTTWKFALTLNTIIAVLGTLSRTTLAFALSSCVGQQKWNWLRRKTDHLAAFERFDEASRGPWGATRLFFWLRARYCTPDILLPDTGTNRPPDTGRLWVRWLSWAPLHSILSYRRFCRHRVSSVKYLPPRSLPTSPQSPRRYGSTLVSFHQ